MKKGTELSLEDQKHVLAAYVHRFTKDHKPAWARGIWKDNKPYPVHFASDKEWLDNTYFQVKKDGSLDFRFHACESVPTWPDNPELRKEKALHPAKNTRA